jgi:hypothetical protein
MPISLVTASAASGGGNISVSLNIPDEQGTFALLFFGHEDAGTPGTPVIPSGASTERLATLTGRFRNGPPEVWMVSDLPTGTHSFGTNFSSGFGSTLLFVALYSGVDPDSPVSASYDSYQGGTSQTRNIVMNEEGARAVAIGDSCCSNMSISSIGNGTLAAVATGNDYGGSVYGIDVPRIGSTTSLTFTIPGSVGEANMYIVILNEGEFITPVDPVEPPAFSPFTIGSGNAYTIGETGNGFVME